MDNLFEVILRVPPLIILDHVLATNFGTKKQSNYEFMKSQIDSFLFNRTTTTTHNLEQNTTDELELNDSDATVLTINLNVLVFLLSFTLFLLSSKHIKRFYLCLISISVLLASSLSNSLFIDFLSSQQTDEISDKKASLFNSKIIKASLISYIAQLILVEVLYSITPTSSNEASAQDDSFHIKKHVSRFLFIIPTIVGVLIQPSADLLENVSAAITVVVCLELIMDWTNFIKDVFRVATEDYTWCKHVIKYHGLLHLLELQWQRLMIPQVLKTFWIAKFIYQLSIILSILVLNSTYFNSNNTQTAEQFFSIKDLFLFTIKQLSVAGCETIICVSGMSSILSSILNKLGQLIQKFLIAIDDGEDRNLGKISAILFFVLALQTGLTEITADLRFVRLYRNLCLLLTANLYIIHSMVNPLLLQLSASKNRSLNRHIRPLIVCALLIIFPSWFFIFLWKHNQLSTWLLAVSTFCVEMVVKVNLTLLIYALYMIDAYRSTIWERLDDYVFYIKSVQSAIQFLFSVFIFCNGAWILIYESGGAIRAMMISIHAYFNIYTQAKDGFKVFNKRRKAVSKLDLLKDATPEQLSKFNDVCAVCYQELTTAKITLCNHYFHSTCLRKCLALTDLCPLCLQVCFKTEKKTSADEKENVTELVESVEEEQ